MVFRIFYAEDNEDDVFILRRMLEKFGLPSELTVRGDGSKAVEYLNEVSVLPVTVQPQLIILDYKMPCLTGLEVLSNIRGKGLDHVPVVLMSSGHFTPTDIFQFTSLGAEFMQKPREFQDYEALVKRFRQLLGQPRAEIEDSTV
jgi:CheY-like chemotaxis protein